MPTSSLGPFGASLWPHALPKVYQGLEAALCIAFLRLQGSVFSSVSNLHMALNATWGHPMRSPWSSSRAFCSSTPGIRRRVCVSPNVLLDESEAPIGVTEVFGRNLCRPEVRGVERFPDIKLRDMQLSSVPKL